MPGDAAGLDDRRVARQGRRTHRNRLCLARITRCRRTVRDYERLPAHHESIVYWAMIITMTRRLARRSRPGLALVLPRGRQCTGWRVGCLA